MVSIANKDLDKLFSTLVKSDPPSFDNLLSEFYSKKEDKSNKIINIQPPIIQKKSGKTIWLNLKDFLKNIRRDPDHVIAFIKLNTEFSVDKVTSRVRDGISFNSKGINSDFIVKIMKKYIDKFVKCSQCNSCITKLAKHDLSQTWTMKCKLCYSENIVSFK